MGHGFHSGIAMLSNQISCISLQLQCLIDDHIGALIEDRVPGRIYQRRDTAMVPTIEIALQCHEQHQHRRHQQHTTT